METINNYLDQSDWRVKENSNGNYSFAGLQGHIANTAMVKWALKNMYYGEIADAHDQAFFHIHDLSHPIIGYCAGWSMGDLIKQGFNCGTQFVYSTPPKHFSTLCGQINNFLFTLTGEWAGAQALNSVDTFCAGFIKADNLTDEEIYQSLRQLVYNLNIKTRIAMQSPFTNFSFDLVVPEDLKGRQVIIGGEEQNFTYGDCQDEVVRFNKIFTEIMMEGDGKNKIFTFPIVTYSITEDFPWDSDLAKDIFTFADEVNSPYFSNFINSNQSPEEVRSMCCRLRLDLTELMNSGGGFFGSGDKTGSLGVVTLNLARLAYIAKTNNQDALKDFNISIENMKPVEAYYKLVAYFTDLARQSLLIKRKTVQQTLDAGLIPYTKKYLGNFDKHFNTVAVNGGHEACLNLLGVGIDDNEGKNLMVGTLNFILNKLSEYQAKDKTLLWNLEASPAEGASTRFAKKDKKQFKHIVTGNGKGDFYTNSTQLPDDYSENVFAVFEHQNDLQPLYTSGTVQHIYMHEPTHNWRVVQSLVKKLFTQYKLPYLSISPTISVCPICGRLDHNVDVCPIDHNPEEIAELLKQGLITEDDIIKI